ncbi:protoporphyrinogen oxidase [Aggregatibacter actinomycetemcomitans serotype e str. SC1083]|uniref:Protoporphyrinogen IX dehydrogenase [quinone] n=1 Tax=Aggregatibacter actinomycetemcomitans serotype e str. SC1083 TaxID=907488 RepID=G4A9L0_AGGAC|nr:menaquinone-dependent protoporphyrinogen IX dehydrogenase [Aggregatibacter actinomycetemcomitans]EGY33296.1 protoporphyrinogen oxidase [Aggregatibacter actinomycetemcomitans serotype e str. SC1083]KYK72924.1 protoporphyrinogen oxidase [Aggregatibacter actinomycetemcomitans serotype e str. SA3096]KYK77231.1 protoporphyrinogen oxidase [Aggregatibacter actinomycetemcomitans serotype e str. SC936]KYK92865.1 protoporphyrinogen oxidase [Aggregatibacter actinomycetemcomitans serotype e str. ANH9776
MKTLILYSTHDGQTKKIADYIAEVITTNVEVKSINEEVNFADYERIIIGASIRYGHFNKQLYKTLEKHTALLNQKTTAFFGVNLTARKTDKATPETNVYVRKFLQRITWQPTISAVFAGALLYPRYGFFDRMMIQLIMRITGGETDLTKEIEYTDWQKVRSFSEAFLQLK